MRRAADEPELMDDPDCDPVALDRTYAQFALVNRTLSGWRGLYRRRLRPVLREAVAARGHATLLDLGSGGGDVTRALARWTRADGLPVRVTGADPDPRAGAFARRGDGAGQGVDPAWRSAHSAQLVAAGERFDVVVSNHLLHHLDDGELAELLADSARLARSLVVHGDLRRSRLAWCTWWVLTLPLIGRRTFLRFDGLLSIRRSRTPGELRALVGGVPGTADGSGAMTWSEHGHGVSRVLVVGEA